MGIHQTLPQFSTLKTETMFTSGYNWKPYITVSFDFYDDKLDVNGLEVFIGNYTVPILSSNFRCSNQGELLKGSSLH